MLRRFVQLSLLAAIAAITAMTLLAFWGGAAPNGGRYDARGTEQLPAV